MAEITSRTPTNAQRVALLRGMSQDARDQLVAAWRAIDNALCPRCAHPIGGREYRITSSNTYEHVACPRLGTSAS